MKIAYSSRSKFLVLCEVALSAEGADLNRGINIPVEVGGYAASVLVTLESGDAEEFETNWENTDPTRFPARIKAAATALFTQGMTGTFHISHGDGLLSIQQSAIQPDAIQPSAAKRSKRWSLEELKASVEAYSEMLRKHHAGQDVVKKAVYEELAQRFGRTPKAFEFRMQNISFVYSLLGRAWLPGLKPAKHVGSQVAIQIEALIAEVEAKELVPQVGFAVEVKKLQHKLLAKPAGVEKPASTVVSVSQHSRDPAVKAWVLKQAQGTCECCGQPAPFVTVDGLPYLEVHHVRHLADGGADTPENAVAICPNCHRELHYGAESEKLVDALVEKVSRLQSA